MKTLGRHIVAEFFGCEGAAIDDLARVEAWMLEAAAAIGATVVSSAFHRYAPQGVSGTLLIAESHLSIHTWPEYGYVAADIFTCGGLWKCITTLPCACSLPHASTRPLACSGRNHASVLCGLEPVGYPVILSPQKMPC